MFYTFVVRMKRIFISLYLVFLLAGCSSIDSDAEKAAGLMNESLKLVKQYNLDESDKYFQQYKQIEKKYKDTDKYQEFEKAYKQYLLGTKK